jgi:hypothetical protein
MSADRAPEDDEALARRLPATRTLEDAPEAVIQRALGLWRAAIPAAAAASPASPPAGLRRLSAVLRADSAAASALAFGLRSSGSGTRQLLYHSDGRDVDLRIMPMPTTHGPRWRIFGQVFGPDERGSAQLRGAQGTQDLAWNDLAEFDFPDLPAGRITIVLRGDDWELELPAIELAA